MLIHDTLTERQKTHGDFHTHAQICQLLKNIMHIQPSWDLLGHDQKEALEMIQHKVARILNGNPHYADHWVDISGYAQLVADRLAPPLSHPTLCTCKYCDELRRKER